MAIEVKYPKEASIWRNLKHGTLYKVWGTAQDKALSSFVIFQISGEPTTYLNRYFVCHTENNKIGIVCVANRFGKLSLNIEFPSKIDEVISPIAWARPLSLWYQRFEVVDD